MPLPRRAAGAPAAAPAPITRGRSGNRRSQQARRRGDLAEDVIEEQPAGGGQRDAVPSRIRWPEATSRSTRAPIDDRVAGRTAGDGAGVDAFAKPQAP